MTLRDTFYEIGRSVAGSATINFQRGACPDQCVGQIADFGDNPIDFPHRAPVTSRKKSPYIVLVMESPHINEFQGKLGPAKGQTGIHIRKYIEDIVRALNIPLPELILVNAIQYQCSLGVATKKHRNKVFRRFWKEGGRKDFERRMQQVYHPGDMLLNCCTGSHPKNGLRQLVTTAIHDSLGKVPLHSGSHPYSWFNDQHRRSVRLVAVQPSALPDAQ